MKNYIKGGILIIIIAFLLIYGNIDVQTKQPDVREFTIFMKIWPEFSATKLDSLIYISIPNGTEMFSGILIQNNDPKENEIRIYLEDNLTNSNWISLQEDFFILQPNESKEVVLELHTPTDATGSINGKLRIESR
ncbi:MAG: hypothetical protein KKF56_05465 [Nanoarchaeota archaeon]|nr:hypothetical protein [Nanoarchaeota archaeon]